MHTKEMHYRAEKDITRSACNVYAQKINWLQKHDSTSCEMLCSCSLVRTNCEGQNEDVRERTSKGKKSSIAEMAGSLCVFQI